MRRKNVHGLTLTILLIFVLVSAVYIQPAKANGTKYIRSGVGTCAQKSDILLKKLGPTQLIHDIAIINATPYKTIVGRNYTALIMVNCSNHGDYEETLNLTAYHNGTSIIIEQWLDNTYSDMFWSMGDVDRDGYINIFDMYLIIEAYNWTGIPGKNPADVNSDGTVGILDSIICTSNLGRDIWTYFGIQKLIQDYATITLDSGDYKIIGFRWNTTGFAYGSYTLSAYAWPVQGETNTGDNMLIDGNVFVTLIGDISGDRFVNAKDAIILGNIFSSHLGQIEFNANADINDDGYVNAEDAVILGAHFGEH